jgi:hypothetical protein
VSTLGRYMLLVSGRADAQGLTHTKGEGKGGGGGDAVSFYY